jgi:hypothetical protein
MENTTNTQTTSATQKCLLHFKASSAVSFSAEEAETRKAAGWTQNDKGYWKRPSVEVELPALTADAILEMLAEASESSKFLVEVANARIYEAARLAIAAELATNPVADIKEIVARSPLDWQSLAADFFTQAAETKRTGITKETWEAFAQDYVQVMFQHPSQVKADNTFKPIETIQLQAAHLQAKFANCKGNTNTVSLLRQFLATWYEATPNQTDYTACFLALDALAGKYAAAATQEL